MSHSLERAKQFLASREAIGLETYGRTVDRTDMSAKEWIARATEEAADGLLYLIAAGRELAKLRADAKRDEWVVEWNEDQQAFHIESCETRFRDTIHAYVEGRNRGAWVTLGTFPSYKVGEDFIQNLREYRARKEASR